VLTQIESRVPHAGKCVSDSVPFRWRGGQGYSRRLLTMSGVGMARTPSCLRQTAADARSAAFSCCRRAASSGVRNRLWMGVNTTARPHNLMRTALGVADRGALG